MNRVAGLSETSRVEGGSPLLRANRSNGKTRGKSRALGWGVWFDRGERFGLKEGHLAS
jgi:hypothetical protein